MEHSGVSLFSAVVGAVVAYSFGYGHAVLKRANKDYRATKALVPGMRRAVWSSFGGLVKVGALGAVIALALAAWVVSDLRERDAADPAAPAASTAAVAPARR